MRGKKALKILDRIELVDPCPIKNFYETATVQESGWFCDRCEKKVHDFSKLSAKQIAKLFRETGGEICASISRDADGRVITAEPAERNLFAAGIIFAATTLAASTAAADRVMPNERLMAAQPVAKAEAERAEGALPSPPPDGSRIEESQLIIPSPTATPTATPTPPPKAKDDSKTKQMTTPGRVILKKK